MFLAQWRRWMNHTNNWLSKTQSQATCGWLTERSSEDGINIVIADFVCPEFSRLVTGINQKKWLHLNCFNYVLIVSPSCDALPFYLWFTISHTCSLSPSHDLWKFHCAIYNVFMNKLLYINRSWSGLPLVINGWLDDVIRRIFSEFPPVCSQFEREQHLEPGTI